MKKRAAAVMGLAGCLAIAIVLYVDRGVPRGSSAGQAPSSGSAGTSYASHDYRLYSPLSELVKASAIIVRVHVVKRLQSYRLPVVPAATGGSSALPPQGTIATGKAAGAPTPAPATPEVLRGPLVTDLLVRVDQVVKGSSVRTGSDLVVTQFGGPDAYGTEVDVGNPLPAAGQEEIDFLAVNQLDSSKFGAISGPQGRYKVNSDGTVSALFTASPVGAKYNHLTISQFVAAIRSAMATPPSSS
ncbi:MAG: hypothetical protein ACRDFX_03775 [Chloroflexota bacterium]